MDNHIVHATNTNNITDCFPHNHNNPYTDGGLFPHSTTHHPFHLHPHSSDHVNQPNSTHHANQANLSHHAGQPNPDHGSWNFEHNAYGIFDGLISDNTHISGNFTWNVNH